MCDISTSQKNVLNWDLRSQISLTSWLSESARWGGKRICSCGSGSLVKPFLCRGPGTYHFLWSVARTRSCCNFTGLLPTTQLSKNEGLCRRGTFCKTRFWFLCEAGQILPFIGFHWGDTQKHTIDPNRPLPKDPPRHGTSRWASVCAAELGKQLKSMLFRVGSWWLYTRLNTII